MDPAAIEEKLAHITSGEIHNRSPTNHLETNYGEKVFSRSALNPQPQKLPNSFIASLGAKLLCSQLLKYSVFWIGESSEQFPLLHLNKISGFEGKNASYGRNK